MKYRSRVHRILKNSVSYWRPLFSIDFKSLASGLATGHELFWPIKQSHWLRHALPQFLVTDVCEAKSALDGSAMGLDLPARTGFHRFWFVHEYTRRTTRARPTVPAQLHRSMPIHTDGLFSSAGAFPSQPSTIEGSHSGRTRLSLLLLFRSRRHEGHPNIKRAFKHSLVNRFIFYGGPSEFSESITDVPRSSVAQSFTIFFRSLWLVHSQIADL